MIKLSILIIVGLLACSQCYAQASVVSPDVKEIDLRLKNFNERRMTAKGLQLFGVLALAGSIIIQSENAGKAKLSKSDIQMPRNLAIVGGACFTLGLAIDLDAGKFLLRKK